MIETKLMEDMKRAMKEGNDIDKNTIQFIRAQILKLKKDKQTAVTDNEIENILVQERKKRYEALVMFEKAGRNDLTENTYKEIACINRYLPKMLTDDELRNELNLLVEEIGADKSKFGQIMGMAKAKFGNRADGKMMSEILKEILK